MVPHDFVRMAHLPLTANQKLDRAALPLPDHSSAADGHSGKPPATPSEAALSTIWADLLDVEAPGTDDNFFDLGGYSLLAMRMLSRVETTFGRHVSVAEFFRSPTIGGLAAVLDATADGIPSSPVVELLRGGSRPPIYFPPGVLGEVQAYPAILQALGDDQAVYGLLGRHPHNTRATSIEAVAAQCCEHLNAFQPEGPVSLAGYSFAGIVAFEMARQLAAQGRRVQFLGVFDTGPDGVGLRSGRSTLLAVLYFIRNLPRWINDEIIRPPALEHVGALWRSCRKLLRSLGSRTAARGGHRAEDMFDTSGWSDELIAHVNDNLCALAAYRYHPYPGHLVLFRAGTRPLLHSHLPDLGWKDYVHGGVEVIDLPGNHDTIMKPPIIHQLAQIFRTVFEDRARAGGVNPRPEFARSLPGSEP